MIRALAALLCLAGAYAQDPPTWRLSPRPTLQIGVVEGDSSYQFYRAVGALRLDDGRIVVLNAGSNQLRVYDARGRFVSAKGRRGKGPGEFSSPVGVYRVARDTLKVFDRGNSRFTVHALDGTFIRYEPAVERRGAFAYDEWLYNRSWIDGPPFARGRAQVRAAIDKLPPPDPALGYRFVKVSPQGHLWLRGAVRRGSPISWTIYDLDARPIGRVTTPASFEIREIGRDYILGTGTDDVDVEYIQLYRLEGASRAPARVLAGIDSARLSNPRQVTDSVFGPLRGLLRSLTSAQEIFYSNPRNDYSYATDVKLLDNWETPPNVVLNIVTAHKLGWTAVAIDKRTGAICGMSIGANSPVGWSSGVVSCE